MPRVHRTTIGFGRPSASAGRLAGYLLQVSIPVLDALNKSPGNSQLNTNAVQLRSVQRYLVETEEGGGSRPTTTHTHTLTFSTLSPPCFPSIRSSSCLQLVHSSDIPLRCPYRLSPAPSSSLPHRSLQSGRDLYRQLRVRRHSQLGIRF
jgi:hypothetical protein